MTPSAAPETPPASPAVPSLRGLYLIGIAAPLLGVGLVFLLNLATPMGYFRQHRAVMAGWSGSQWLNFSGFVQIPIALVTALTVLCLRLMAAPLRHHLELDRRGETPPPSLHNGARRRLLNLPLLYIPYSLAMWLALPAIMVLFAVWFGRLDARTGLVLATRASLVGFIASAVAFFALESFCRRRLIPHFFPQGRLTRVPGAGRLSIGRRIRLLYRLGSVVPMIILLVTLITLLWELDETAMTAPEFGRGIVRFTVVLSLIAFAAAGLLNRLVSRSVTEPIQDMLRVVDRVRDGDYDARVRVVGNDEIGVLGDAANAMIRGLAERERLRAAFGRYVTPEIGAEILSGKIPLDGRRMEATVMFVDLRGFTSFVETHPPEAVITAMRSYFTAMHRVIQRHQGVVLQFVGDQIEAAFGVPVPSQDHADRALAAALEMRRALAELNAVRAESGDIPLAHGIGLHTGLVLAGISGSEHQSAYALIGDTVNVASRIQEMTKTLGTDILVSEDTTRRLGPGVTLEPQPPQPVRGRSRPVLVYRLPD